MSRPEHIAPPEIFYNDSEAGKYTSNTRVQQIQAEMTYRALELLGDNDGQTPKFLLDIGCGSGLSGEILDEEGHYWLGCDISPSMLSIALERDLEGDLMLSDIGSGVHVRAGSFDGAISISVLQWLCNADSTSANPGSRLMRFFNSLYAALSRGSRAVFQFYPESDDQVGFIMGFAQKAGFSGGLVVDYPNSRKAKKFYLCLFAGVSGKEVQMPAAKTETGTVSNVGRQSQSTHRPPRTNIKHSAKDHINHKKHLQRQKGKQGVPLDSKYTGRKRRDGF
ncbi:hypothetical protein E3P92_00667 [Wallemia ichthyophaga]|uniref:18S rRNA (Guanine-N(7))-methyltransferase n=2 Tax=Wallemia ichthyophaga TaxID=245174 RepID=A0A4T0JCK2_WALIC|nr:Putative methyltransferase BUD23 [Wallemia ichthyophaga EXF-994]TIA75800.1 hypothetical protein E3P91_00184 [Wallemia ichthyophaga]EOQ98882.1 Putative methyltransferase BUD23 [Wallemia ichthyophaga EXF-994]TIA79718.1 hypothetical protein E3P98_03118 [Wallemia ichthyophaga]TIA93290.1 hypothetical protein E3P97_01055 [Wallemia ichthyophaga]TIA98059.1 hypothetical protein E3P95_02605 [Wallemia ichthyophaga]